MRKEMCFDKNWRFLPDDGPKVELLQHSEAYGNCKAGGVLGIPSRDFDDRGWRMLDVPHDYLTEAEYDPATLISYAYKKRHNAWYRKTFRLPEEYRGKQLLLVFEGIAVQACVYLNGSLMGRSFSANAPLMIDISDRVSFGERDNVLAVFIDGITTEGWWYEGAGIYRHVRLFVKENVHIAPDSVFAKPVLRAGTENTWDVFVEAEAENTGYENADITFRAVLNDGETRIAAAESSVLPCPAGGKTKILLSFTVDNPERWDIDDPKLYICGVTLSSGTVEQDTEHVPVGVRTFTVDRDHGFFLNGKPIKLKGVCCHQDHACVGAAVQDSVQEYRIHRIKALGANAYRCAHNMPADALLDACDRLGLLVMDENRRFETRPEVLGHLEAMVKHARNHPSVVLYSLLNEEPLQGTEEGARIFRRLRQTVLRLDDTRLLTGAMNYGFLEPDGTGPLMDVVGINYDIEHGVPKFRELYPELCVFGSENNCALSTRGCYRSDAAAHVSSCYDDDYAPWGQTIKTTWECARKNDWFGGIFIWSGFDYRGEPTPFDWPSISTQFGIMDTCGFAKDSFYQNRACFVTEPVLHILPHWNWNAGDEVRVMTASNCEEVELFLNGTSLGRKPSDCCAPAEWLVPFVPGVLSAVGYRGGTAVAEAKREMTGTPVSVVIEAYRNTLAGDGADTAILNLSVRDAKGLTCETADTEILLEIIGDGVLLGVGNGDPNDQIKEHEPHIRLFCGHAQALVQSGTGARSVMIRAQADGLAPAELELNVLPGIIPDYL